MVTFILRSFLELLAPCQSQVRNVNALCYLKTYLRSTMAEERLNGLAMLYVHRDIPYPPDAVVNEFAHLQPRKLEPVNHSKLKVSTVQTYDCMNS